MRQYMVVKGDDVEYYYHEYYKFGAYLTVNH